MTTTEIAKIEDGVIDAEIEPINKTDAKRLDKKIRSSSDRINNGIEKIEDEMSNLATLLEEAAEGQIHVALGLKSWTAYVKDAVQFRPSDRAERKALATLMSGKQMSQRAIAAVLGVSQKTVDRDLEGETFDSDSVTTIDGKTAPRNKPAKEVEEEEDSDSEAPVAKQTSVVEDFRNEVYQLQNDVEAFREVLDDERFPKARKRLSGQKIVDDFRECINKLDDMLVIIVGKETDAEDGEAE